MHRHVQYIHSQANAERNQSRSNSNPFTSNHEDYLPENQNTDDSTSDFSNDPISGLSRSDTYVWTSYVARKLDGIHDTLKVIMAILLKQSQS
ncbi:MAG TPA: hypothetical protein VH415_02775 [Nitrososphaeraceae archaeon]